MASPRSNSLVATASNRGALILVVERNPMVQRLERYFPEQAGFSVEFTADGITAGDSTRVSLSRKLRNR